MKILHITLGLGKGGAERLLVDTLPEYVNMGLRVDLLQISSRWQYNAYVDILLANGVGVFSLTNGSAKNIGLVFKLRKFLKKNRYDIVHVHLFPSLYFVVLATRFLYPCPKLIFTEHSSQNKRSTKRYLDPFEKYTYAAYDRVVAVSEFIKNRLETNLGIKNVNVIKNGVSINSFENAEAYPKSYWTQKHGLQPDAVTILMVARFNYPKDHKTAMLALNKLPENFVLFFAGDGKRIKKIKKLATQLNLSHRIHFLGFRDDIPQLMKSADFVILPTEYEGMSGVTLEAMVSKSCFLGADVAGVAEVVPDSRYLFNKSDYEQLSQRIIHLTSQNEVSENLKNHAYLHVRQFSLDKMVCQYAEMYQNIVR